MSGLFFGEFEFDPVDLEAYFKRIGYVGSREPNLATLRELHRLHPAQIPFEALDVRIEKTIDLAASAIDAKLITGGRGGYCFEQNSLFLRVLRTLGYQADGLIARSRWQRPLSETVARTHMAIRVKLDDDYWLADVGFGACMLTSPLNMNVAEAQKTIHEPARLVPADDELRLERLLAGEWTPLYDLVLIPQLPVDFLAANWLISTHPASSFKQHLVASRTFDNIRFILVDRRLTIRRAGIPVEYKELTSHELKDCLTDVFGLNIKEQNFHL